MRFFSLFFCLAACVWLPHAGANPPSGQAAPTALALLGNQLAAPHLTISERLPRNRSIESIANDAALFTQSFDSTKAYAMGAQSATWLHFRVLAADVPPPMGWTLELPKPYIDHVEFYQKDAQGKWQMQVAGDRIAHKLWPLQGLYPQFALPVMAAGVHDFYLKIQNDIPAHFSVNLQRADRASQRGQNSFLLGGLLVGVCALMMAYRMVLAFSASKNVYAWFALFVGLSCLATVTYLGLANYALWPRATVWPDYSLYVLAMAAGIAQLQCCRVVYLPRAVRSRLQTVLSISVNCCTAATGFYLYCDNPVIRQVLYSLIMCVCVTLVIALSVRAMRHGDQTAWLWLLAYLPMLVSVALASANNFGFAINGIPFDMPVYALLFEASVILVALQRHAKSQHERSVRRSLLDHIDPHTGLLAPRTYTATAGKLWNQSRQNQGRLAVAYVEARSTTALPSVQQIVRLLRTVARDGDLVAQVDKNLYAILMPGLPAGEDLAHRLSRLVALGLMAGKDTAATGPVQFRIAVSSSGSFAGTWQALDAALITKLKQTTGWEQRNIRFVRERSSTDFDALWQHAVTASAQLEKL